MTHHPHLYPYIVQTWKGERLLSELGPLSWDAAREIARAHRILPDVVTRLMAEGHDYCEVWNSEDIRCGTFAQTTMVRVPENSTVSRRPS